jgi:hypothetical protein
MGLVEGVDYWYQEEHEVTPLVWSSVDNDVPPYAPGTVGTGGVEVSRLDWTCPETEVYLFFFSFESDMHRPVADVHYAMYTGASATKKSVSSITESGGTATVTTSAAHGFLTNQYVHVEGADQSEYNGDYFQITRLDPQDSTSTQFSYAVSGSPANGTGTISVRQEPISTSTMTNHIGIEGTGAGTPSYQGFCWVGVATVEAGSAWGAITGRSWQGQGDISVRRCRICVIKASSLTKGWGVGAQQQGTHSDTANDHWNPITDGNGDVFASIEETSGKAGLDQIYTPPGPAPEQTLVFASLVTSETLDWTAPRAACTYAIRNVTDDVNFAVDMSRPLVESNNVNWTFGMAVRDNNDSPSSWQILGREANNTGSQVLFRRGFVIIIGLDGV